MTSPRLVAPIAACVLLGACEPKPEPEAPPAPVSVATAIEREFDTYCLATGGDAERTAAALKGAGWWAAPPGLHGVRAFEERLPGNRVGDGMVFTYDNTCDLSREASDPEAVATLLTQRLARRFGGSAPLPDWQRKPCADFPRQGVTYSACYNEYPDAPATASLKVVWNANETQGAGQ